MKVTTPLPHTPGKHSDFDQDGKPCKHMKNSPIRRHPDALLVSQMQAMLQDGRYAALEVYCDSLCESRPEFGPAWHFLGLANLRLGRVDQACNALNAAIERMPDNADAWDHLGMACAAAGDTRTAIHAFEQAQFADPKRASTLVNLAKVALDAGNHAGAEAYARRAIKLRPGLLQARIHLALSLSGQGRHDEATEITRSLLAVAPHTPELLAAHAHCTQAKPA